MEREDDEGGDEERDSRGSWSWGEREVMLMKVGLDDDGSRVCATS